jgi:hypothetical protein
LFFIVHLIGMQFVKLWWQWCVLLRNEAFGIKLSYYFILMCVCGCRDFGPRDGMMEGSIKGRMWRR